MAVIVICYMTAMLGIGFLASKYLVKSSDDYWVGGRKFGVGLLWATCFTAFISAGSMLGYMAMYYSSGGYAGIWLLIAIGFGWLLIVPFFLHKIRRMGFVSMGDLYFERYGPKAHLVATIVILYTTVGYLVTQMMGMGTALSVLLGWPMRTSMIVGFVVVIVYTWAGGLPAVAWTDVAQGLLILSCSVIAFPLALSFVGGFGPLKSRLIETAPYFFDATAKGMFNFQYSLKSVLMFGLGDLALPIIFVRSLAARDEHVARFGFILAGLSIVVVYVTSIPLMGCVRVLLPAINPKMGDAIWPTAIRSLFPPVLAGVLLAAILAAIMSTCDALLHLGGTVFARDIYQRLINKNATDAESLKVSRAGVVLIGALGLLLPLLFPSTIFKVMVYIFQFITNGLAIPVATAYYWKRANETGAVASSVAGTLVTLFWGFGGRPFGLDEFFAGLIASILGMVIGSLVTAPPDESIVKKFFGPHMSFMNSPD